MDLKQYNNEWKARESLLIMTQPAGWWRDAFPLGNGHLGAMPYGRLCEERILINHERLWYEGVVPELPDLSALLGQCRRLLAQGDYLAANELYWNALKTEGKEGRCAVYHPAADICFSSVSQARFKCYQRYLDMARAESMTYWEWLGQPQMRRSFVSRADDCIVVEQQGSGLASNAWELRLELHELLDAIHPDGELFQPTIDFSVRVEGEWILAKGRYTDPNYHGAEYGIVARVQTDGELTALKSGKGLILTSAQSVLLLAKVYVYESGDAVIERLQQEIVALGSNYEALLQAHVALQRPRFESCRVQLDRDDTRQMNETLLLEAYSGSMSIELLQKMTEYGRYLLINSSDASSVPSNLQGIWNGDYAPPWHCFLMINENLQMNYWQALPGGMDETVLGVFNFYESNLDDYRENARKLFGCRGIYIPALSSPETGLSTFSGSWIVNWISGAGWLCQLFYDYYLFTNDEVFLKERLLPFMSEVALFYKDYFTYDSAGNIVIAPSTSPENWPKEFCEIESPTSIHPRLAVNATIDVAIARELFGNLLQGARDFSMYQESWEQWECILKGLPGYAINEAGAIREWLDFRYSDNYEHRHLSHIYPVFPGYEVTKESHPILFPAFEKAVDLRGSVGLKDQTGWSLAHMANIRARMGNGAGAFECLETIMQTCVGKNLFTYHNDYRGSGISGEWYFGRSTPFQIDANMGLTAAVYEMLVQSGPDFIKLLPALPEQLRGGKVVGMGTRTAVNLDLEWQSEPFRLKATFRSRRDQTIRLYLHESKEPLELPLLANTPLEKSWIMRHKQLV